MDLALDASGDPHERVLVEVNALAVDLDPAGALQREVDLLLAVMLVIGGCPGKAYEISEMTELTAA